MSCWSKQSLKIERNNNGQLIAPILALEVLFYLSTLDQPPISRRTCISRVPAILRDMPMAVGYEQSLVSKGTQYQAAPCANSERITKYDVRPRLVASENYHLGHSGL